MNKTERLVLETAEKAAGTIIETVERKLETLKRCKKDFEDGEASAIEDAAKTASRYMVNRFEMEIEVVEDVLKSIREDWEISKKYVRGW